jgi:protein gp37
MGDLFHEAVADEFIDAVFMVTAKAHWHTFQVLTKRADRLPQYFARNLPKSISPLENVWLGVSVEDQKTADERIPILLQTPAAVRFVSVEPMLGPVDLSEWLRVHQVNLGPGRERHWTENNYEVSKLDWIIVGGETGPKARPIHPAWVRSLRDQCHAAGVPFFMKQMSKRAPIPEDLAIRQFPDGK